MTTPPRAWMQTKKFTVKEVAGEINRSAKTVRKMIADGKLKPLPLGKPYLITAEEVRRLIGVEV